MEPKTESYSEITFPVNHPEIPAEFKPGPAKCVSETKAGVTTEKWEAI